MNRLKFVFSKANQSEDDLCLFQFRSLTLVSLVEYCTGLDRHFQFSSKVGTMVEHLSRSKISVKSSKTTGRRHPFRIRLENNAKKVCRLLLKTPHRVKTRAEHVIPDDPPMSDVGEECSSGLWAGNLKERNCQVHYNEKLHSPCTWQCVDSKRNVFPVKKRTL